MDSETFFYRYRFLAVWADSALRFVQSVQFLPAAYLTEHATGVFFLHYPHINDFSFLSFISPSFFLSLYKRTAIYSNIRDYVTPEKSSLNE